jgi:hypothetical protein
LTLTAKVNDAKLNQSRAELFVGKMLNIDNVPTKMAIGG